jgi:hypothetical protein
MFSSPLPLGKDVIIAVGSNVVQVPDSEFNGEEEGRCRELRLSQHVGTPSPVASD